MKTLYPYQKKAVNFQCTHPESMLWLDMGLGKTVVTLTSINHLLGTGHLRGCLIVAPIKVIRLVWKQEALKWGHTKDLKFVSLLGNRDQRTRALLRPGQIFLINYENIKWLAETLHQYFIKKGKPIPFNGVVWDEVSKMKNSGTKRVRSIKYILDHFEWSTGLTGTPASNGYKDLHGQFLVVDKGKRLGTSKTAFETRFYHTVQGTFKKIPFPDTEEKVKNLIGDITLEMSAQDYNPLPDILINPVRIELPSDLRSKYDSLEKQFFFELDNGKEIEVFNKSALGNKCLQFSNGAVYPMPGNVEYEEVHKLKLDALEDIIDEANGNPVLCSYMYRSDADRIMKRFKSLSPINLTECKTQTALDNAMTRWKKGDCRLMIGHPASMGHGIDGLQDHGHILVWFGLTWSLDLYSQFNARIRRQGQGIPVICHHIITVDTIDEVQLARLNEKSETESSLRRVIKEYRQRRGV